MSAEAPGRCCDGRRARVEVLERLGDVDVEDEDAAVGAAVEGDAQALEALLTRRVPDLRRGRDRGRGSSGPAVSQGRRACRGAGVCHGGAAGLGHSPPAGLRGSGSAGGTAGGSAGGAVQGRCWGGAGVVWWSCQVTCMVTSLSSTVTSLVRKSAPMVALYLRGAARTGLGRCRRVAVLWQGSSCLSGVAAAHWLLNFLLTYWFMSEVLPTPESPRMITFSSTFLRLAMAVSVPAHATAHH